jgi:hypothetical protein
MFKTKLGVYMKSLIALSAIVFSAATMAGPSVSGGIAYHQDFEKCENKKLNSGISIEANVLPSNISGFMWEGETSSVQMKCVQTKNETAKTGEELVWKCNEQRAGEGQLYVEISRKSNGVKYASIYRKNILNQNHFMYKMSCNQTISPVNY